MSKRVPNRTCAGGFEALHDTCNCGEPHWTRIRDLKLKPLPRLVLDLSRCCCGGYGSDELKLWDFALFTAMNSLGVAHGSAMFGHVAGLTKAVRMERPGTFEHLTVKCAKLTPDELELVHAIALVCENDEADLRRVAVGLVGSPRCAATCVALDALGAVCRLCDWYNKERRNQPSHAQAQVLH